MRVMYSCRAFMLCVCVFHVFVAALAVAATRASAPIARLSPAASAPRAAPAPPCHPCLSYAADHAPTSPPLTTLLSVNQVVLQTGCINMPKMQTMASVSVPLH